VFGEHIIAPGGYTVAYRSQFVNDNMVWWRSGEKPPDKDERTKPEQPASAG
jgi:hypothetical protein